MDFGTVRLRPLASSRQARVTVRPRLTASLHLQYDIIYGYEIQLTVEAMACMVATLQL